MSNKGINLIKTEKDTKKLSPIRGRLWIFRLISMLLLFGVGLASVIVTILIAYSPLPELQKIEAEERSNLSQYNIDINKVVFVNERGDSIREILKNRNSYDAKLNYIKEVVPSGVAFEGFTLEDKRYTLRFSSRNLESLDSLVDSIVNASGKDKQFLRVFQSSLSVDVERSNFVLVVDLLAV